jgi:dTDP-4-amino-4,6-dideoxygalactose transaminase
MIPFNKPTFGQEEEDALIRVLRTGHLTAGKEVQAFEKEFAEYIGAPYVVAVDSCTNALWLSLRYERRNGPREIGCPGMTFASVAHTIVQNDHGLTFTDEYHAGSAYQLRNTNIWDCAHQIERGMYKKGTTMCFSFYPNKVLSSAEGGAIATDDPEMVEWLKGARWNGRYARSFSDYDIKFAGWKMNMTDIQACLVREQLKKLDSFNSRRAEIKAEYDKHFTQVNEWHYLYVVEVDNRDEFLKKMSDSGVECSFHYKPLYEQPAYQDLKADYYYLDSIKDRIVTLPLYPALTNNDVAQIIGLTKQHKM